MTTDLASSFTIAPGNTQLYTPTARVVGITVIRAGAGNPTRALEITCGFPIGVITFCDGIDVKP